MLILGTIILFFAINVGFLIEMKYIMKLGKKEIIITLVFSNLLLGIAAILQNKLVAYIALGVGFAISVIYSVIKLFKEKE